MRTAHLQIRVTPAEKAQIERAARRAGKGMSAYVLGKVLPSQAGRWRAHLREIERSGGARIALAALSSWLAGLTAGDLKESLEAPLPAGLSASQANTLAAMVEHTCAAQGVSPPDWTRQVQPLARPEFGSQLASLRLHLLSHSPAAYRRRNLFVDTPVGGQV